MKKQNQSSNAIFVVLGLLAFAGLIGLGIRFIYVGDVPPAAEMQHMYAGAGLSVGGLAALHLRRRISRRRNH